VPVPNVSVTTIKVVGDTLHLEGLSQVGHLEHIVLPDSP
jgi:hypothetical protein